MGECGGVFLGGRGCVVVGEGGGGVESEEEGGGCDGVVG